MPSDITSQNIMCRPSPVQISSALYQTTMALASAPILIRIIRTRKNVTLLLIITMLEITHCAWIGTSTIAPANLMDLISSMTLHRLINDNIGIAWIAIFQVNNVLYYCQGSLFALSSKQWVVLWDDYKSFRNTPCFWFKLIRYNLFCRVENSSTYLA